MKAWPGSTRSTLFATPHVLLERRADGGLLLRSEDPLREHPPTVLHSFRRWAVAEPDRVLVAERPGGEGEWRTLTYGEAERAALSVGQGLLDLGLGPDRPLLVLSGNSVDHLVVTLGAMVAGVPVAPVSVAYSLMSQDHARLRAIASLTGPGASYAEDAGVYAAALDALGELPRIVSRGPGGTTLDSPRATAPGAEVEAAYDALTGDSVAKLLFTSGSTGAPKGVLTTHRMMAANQQMMRQVWPFLADEPPVIVDWLPWSHVFGGSHNLNLVLVNGGTLYVDAGRPAPGMFAPTLANLRDVPPTVYFNVPAGYAQLVPALESDPELAAAFFSQLRLIFNAAAALPAGLRERLLRLGEATTGQPVPVTGSWGLTETAPAVTNAHFDFGDARSIGVPLPGLEVLLAPGDDAAGDAREIRVRGPVVTPGYHGRPDLTAEAFDDEGFYRTGDAVSLADPEHPGLGLVFRGRLVEDFKLSTGTFVHVGAVRTSLLSAVPVLADAVITGEGRDEAGALAWLNGPEVVRLLGRDPVVEGELVIDPELAAHLSAALLQQDGHLGSSGRVARLLVMSRPAGLDAGEITDKGYVNQRRVLANRAHLVDLLYDDEPVGAVVTAGR
jgi:feruloyl-CoA synthase